MQIWEFMTRKIEWISADSSVYEAIERMVSKRIRSLAVYYPEDDERKSVITARDIVYRVLGEDKNPRKVKIREVVNRPIICISKDRDISEAVAIMKEENIARVFVCDGGQIVGIVALMDVMYATLIERARNNNV